MITEKLFKKIKSPQISNSRLAHSKIVQIFFKHGLRGYNFLVSHTPLFQHRIKGSCGTGNNIHSSAIIDRKNVVIGNFCMIGKNVIIEKNTIIGNHVTIQEGAVLGSEGFEFRRIAGEIVPIVHTGGVIIHDNVIIGQSVCIDKSSFGNYTEIGESSYIHARTNIGHGVRIGKGAVLAQGTIVGGYADIGKQVRIGRDVSLADEIILDDEVCVPDCAVVTRDLRKMRNDAGTCPAHPGKD